MSSMAGVEVVLLSETFCRSKTILLNVILFLMTTLSVIIPTYNRTNCLRDTLLSILLSIKEVKEIIIVDQSRDEIFQEIEKIVLDLRERIAGTGNNCTEVKLIHLENPSLTKARNVGGNAATGDWLVFCDDDVIWPQNLGINILTFFRKNSNLALVGGYNYKSIDGNGVVGNADATKSIKCLLSQKRYFFLARWLRAFVGRSSYCADRAVMSSAIYGTFPDRVKSVCNTEWAMGFFFMVPRKVFSEWKICLDENLRRYAYAEDLDFTHRVYLRAKQEKLRCVYVPEIGVWHKHSQEWRIAPVWLQYAGFMNRVYIARKLADTPWKKIYFSWGIFKGECWNFLRTFKDGGIKLFFKIRWDYLKNRSRINREGWYFLLEK